MTEQQKSPGNQSSESLFQRLIQRHVIQSAAIYIAVAWGALEIIITLQEKLGWPPVFSVWATRFFVAGFPLAIILAWRRDVKSRAARVGLIAAAVSAALVVMWLTLATDPVERSASPTVDPVNDALAIVAVMPFDNAGGEPTLDYLASGFTGELIGRLSKHPDLAIVQEESLRAAALLDLVTPAQAAELRANYLVQGRVLKEGGFVEVTSSLQNLDGIVIWSETLREPYSAEGVVAMQRRISGEISRTLGTTLEAQPFCGETADIGAMELHYRGRMKVGTRQPQSVMEGLELLKQAVHKDPYYGRAWSVYGDANLYLSGLKRGEDRQSAGLLWQLGMEAYRRALDICPTIGMAYKVVVPANEGVENPVIDQELQYRAALAMDPNDAALLRQYFYHLMNAGRLEQALAVMQRAYEIEPLLAMIPAQYAQALSKVGRCGEAMTLALEAEALGGMPSAVTSVSCAMQNREAATLTLAAASLVNEGLPDPSKVLNIHPEELSLAMLDPSHPRRSELARGLWATWEKNPDIQSNEHVYWLINVATDVGEYELVLNLVEAAIDQCDLRCYNLAWTPLFNVGEASGQLRSHPRFVRVMGKSNLPDYWREIGWPNGCEPAGDSFRCF